MVPLEQAWLNRFDLFLAFSGGFKDEGTGKRYWETRPLESLKKEL